MEYGVLITVFLVLAVSVYVGIKNKKKNKYKLYDKKVIILKRNKSF